MLIKPILILLLVWSMLPACSDDTMNRIDTDPNNPTDVTVDLLLPQAISGVAYNVSGTDLAWYSALFVEHFAGVNGVMRDYDMRLGLTPSMADNPWLYVYTGTLKDIKTILEKTSATGSEPNYHLAAGIAKVLYAYSMSVTTDMWGSVPASDALDPQNDYPKFDTQQQIYSNLLQMIDEAITDLDAHTSTATVAADMIYHGDAKLWQKAAYALKARLCMHLSTRDPNYIQTALDCIANSFTSVEENLTFSSFTNNTQSANPWYQEKTSKGYFAVSRTLYNTLLSINYPLTNKIIANNGNGQISAASNGKAVQDATGLIYSKVSDYLVYPTAPLPLITYSELKFIAAEAYLKQGNTSSANTAFQDGVVAMLIQSGYTDVLGIYNYLSVLPSANLLSTQTIIKYKYVLFWPYQPIEAYNDWRRTGYPTLSNSNAPPRRLPYPQSEISTNPTHCKDNSSLLQNGVWWDDGSDD